MTESFTKTDNNQKVLFFLNIPEKVFGLLALQQKKMKE